MDELGIASVTKMANRRGITPGHLNFETVAARVGRRPMIGVTQTGCEADALRRYASEAARWAIASSDRTTSSGRPDTPRADG